MPDPLYKMLHVDNFLYYYKDTTTSEKKRLNFNILVLRNMEATCTSQRLSICKLLQVKRYRKTFNPKIHFCKAIWLKCAKLGLTKMNLIHDTKILIGLVKCLVHIRHEVVKKDVGRYLLCTVYPIFKILSTLLVR